MKRILFLCFSALFLLTACSEEVRQVDAAATNFYHNLKTEDYEAIKPMIYKKALEASSWEYWKSAISRNQEEYGSLKSFSCTGTKYVDDNMGLRYQLRYEVEYEKETKTEELVFLKVDGRYQLVHYQFQ